jgi:hypothetical protein
MQITWITNYFFLSNPIILVQIPTGLTVTCFVSLMSCRAIQIMWRPSSNLLQRYFPIQICLILLAVKWCYWQATIPWNCQPTRRRVRVHCRRQLGHQNRSGVGERLGVLGEEFGILLVVGCSLATAGLLFLSWTLGASFGGRIIEVSSASRTCAHLGSWIGLILLILLFLCHKILTQKFNSIVLIDRSGIRKERREILVLGGFI